MSEIVLNFIRNEFHKKTEKNPKFSIRAFAKTLQVSPSTLSRILANKRYLSVAMANDILKNLNIDVSTKNTLLLTYADPPKQTYNMDHFSDTIRYLSDTETELTAHWHYSTVVLAIKLLAPATDSQTLHNFLKFEKERLDEVLKNLTDLGIISKNHDKYQVNDLVYANPKHKAGIIKAHKSHIKAALEHLDVAKANTTAYFGFTLNVDQKLSLEVERRVQEFAKNLYHWLENVPNQTKDSVYRFNIQYFPLARKNRKTDKDLLI